MTPEVNENKESGENNPESPKKPEDELGAQKLVDGIDNFGEGLANADAEAQKILTDLGIDQEEVDQLDPDGKLSRLANECESKISNIMKDPEDLKRFNTYLSSPGIKAKIEGLQQKYLDSLSKLEEAKTNALNNTDELDNEEVEKAFTETNQALENFLTYIVQLPGLYENYKRGVTGLGDVSINFNQSDGADGMM